MLRTFLTTCAALLLIAKAAAQEIVFLALHPPAIGGGLAHIKISLKPEAILVSLAPRFTIKAFSEALGGFDRIVRMIPNAPSVVNEGYNPVAFGPGITKKEKEDLSRLFKKLGDCPEVDEEKLEAYAIITAIGVPPTCGSSSTNCGNWAFLYSHPLARSIVGSSEQDKSGSADRRKHPIPPTRYCPARRRTMCRNWISRVRSTCKITRTSTTWGLCETNGA